MEIIFNLSAEVRHDACVQVSKEIATGTHKFIVCSDTPQY